MNFGKRIQHSFCKGSLYLVSCLVHIVITGKLCWGISPTEMLNDSTDVLFATQEPLNIKLQLDWVSLQNDRGKDPSYHHAFIILEDGMEIPVRLKARGNNRKKKDVCEIPPLKIEFGSQAIDQSLFRGQEELKLVTFCQEEESVLTEYLIYKMYQILEPRSLNVRLAKIDYVDRSGKRISRSFAFFLEDIDHLADRINGDEENDRIDPNEMDRQALTLLYVFQYMIGNIDWDIKMMKNIKLIDFKDRPTLPVPYDFDYSLMVDAPYFPSYEGIELNRRKFKKVCRDRTEFSTVFNLFNSKKDSLYQLVSNFPYLRTTKQKTILNYLDLFYQEISDPEVIKQIFLDICKEG